MLLHRFFRPLFAFRARRESIRADRLRQMQARATLYPGPPAIVLARKAVRTRPDLAIDPFETEFRLERGRLSVRAWLTLDADDVPPDMLKAIGLAEERLAGLPPEARRIYFLSTSYRLKVAEISAMLGLSRREIRRHLMTAIARLDGRRL